MKTVYSDDRRRRHARFELDGRRMPAYEKPARADFIIDRVRGRALARCCPGRYNCLHGGRRTAPAGEPEMSKPTIMQPQDGPSVDFGGLGVHWKINGADTDQRFAVVHHPIAPRALAAPLHYHHNEDEYSYVLEGTLGALLGDEVVTAEPGTWVYKPRQQWHTFWNAGDTPCVIIEIISPAAFANYFHEVAAAWGDMEQFARINDKYQLDMDFDSVPGLCERFGLTFPAM